jgi:hypothetical protein
LKRTALATLLAALVAGVLLGGSGCGGGGSDTTGGETTSATTAEGNGGTTKPGGESNAGGSKKSGGEKGGGGGGGDGTAGGGQNYNREPTKKEVEGYKAPPGGDNSIQTFGSEAPESEEEEIVTSMRSFLRALASLDYQAICDGITSSNREAFVKLLQAEKKAGTCESVLQGLLQRGSAEEAQKAANGVVYQVRVEGENAFVLFTPEDGVASYFVMKKEGGTWKATGVNAGAPFNPLEQSGAAQ